MHLTPKTFAEQWKVIDHLPNTKSGFSGTPFKKVGSNEFVISYRSTEFIDDYARDNVATNQLEIKDNGWALGKSMTWRRGSKLSKSQIHRPVIRDRLEAEALVDAS